MMFSILLAVALGSPEPLPLPMPGPGPTVLVEPGQPPAKADAPAKVGPVACVIIRAKLAEEYRKKGMSRIEARRKAAEITDEEINLVAPDAEKASGQKVVGQLGDGTLFAKLLELLSNPQFQAFLEALIKLLMGLAVNGDLPWHDFYTLVLPLLELRDIVRA